LALYVLTAVFALRTRPAFLLVDLNADKRLRKRTGINFMSLMYVLASEKFVGFAAWGNGPGGGLLVPIYIMAFNPEPRSYWVGIGAFAKNRRSEIQTAAPVGTSAQCRNAALGHGFFSPKKYPPPGSRPKPTSMAAPRGGGYHRRRTFFLAGMAGGKGVLRRKNTQRKSKKRRPRQESTTSSKSRRAIRKTKDASEQAHGNHGPNS
jgi:hypothetical protein